MPDAQLGEEGGGGEAFPALSSNKKKCPHFGKKGPNCVHPCVESSIQKVILRVSRRKSSKIFPCFFSGTFDEKFIELP